MFGAELDSPEFAYLLALVDAQGIIGVDAPDLFPLDDSSRNAVYSAGRESLGMHGWLEQAEESPNEFNLAPLLFEATAILATPEIVVATMRDTGDVERQLVQHYVANDEIVELSATAEQKYRIGVLANKNALYERIVQILNLVDSPRSGHFSLDEHTLTSIQSLCREGELEQAKVLMSTANLNGELGESFVESLGSSVSGQVVVVRAQFGEIKAGRRALIFGEGDGAWILVRAAANSHEFKATAYSLENLRTLVAKWWEELLALGR